MKLLKLTQGHLEDYEEYILEKQDYIKSAAWYNRMIIDAASESGFATELPDDLRQCSPPEIVEMTQAIIEHVNKAKQPVTKN